MKYIKSAFALATLLSVAGCNKEVITYNEAECSQADRKGQTYVAESLIGELKKRMVLTEDGEQVLSRSEPAVSKFDTQSYQKLMNLFCEGFYSPDEISEFLKRKREQPPPLPAVPEEVPKADLI